MALTAVGTLVGFNTTEFKDRETGELKNSHKVSVSTGDSVVELSVADDLLRQMGAEVGRLRVFGQPCRCRVRVGAFGRDGGGATLSLRLTGIEFLTMADLVIAGYEVEVYDEKAEQALAAVPSGNGSGKS